MFHFVIRKMLNKKWMTIALLVGNVLLVAIASSGAMYTETALQRTLNVALKDAIVENNTYPLIYSVKTSSAEQQNDEIRRTTDKMRASGEDFGIPVAESIVCYYNLSSETESDMDREDRVSSMVVGALSDLNAHIKVLEGTDLSGDFNEDGSVDLIIPEKTFQDLRLLIGETLTFEKYLLPDGTPLKGRVAGVFTVSSPEDYYWVEEPGSYRDMVFMDEGLFQDIFMYEGSGTMVNARWYTLYDYKALKAGNVQNMIDTANEYHLYFKSLKAGYLDSQKGSCNFEELLQDFMKTEKKVRTTFTVLQVPIYVLLALFIFMLSRQIIDLEESEIAVLKSRGAGKGQILSIYFLEGVIMAGLSLLIGLPLGYLLSAVLGSANAFLEFVYRPDLKVVLTPKAFLYALIAVLFSIVSMVLPAFRYSKESIVNQKQRKHRSDKPFWQRFFLDVVLLGVSLYGLYSFNSQKDALTQRVLSGESLDPLLFLSSSLFMIGAGLLMLRLIPLIEKLIYKIFEKKWSPALYTSFLQVLRTRKTQGFIMVFLVMTIALGVFNASAARTVNGNDERNLRYLNGAEIVLKEKWFSNEDQVAQDPNVELQYVEPDYGRFKSMEGKEAGTVTRVYKNQEAVVNLSGTGKLWNVCLTGIDSEEFGRTAWFDESLISPHWYNYLNALGQQSNAVILSANFKEYGFKLNDSIYFSLNNESMMGTVCGFVEYWPSVAQFGYEQDDDGVFRETEKFTIIANLSQLQTVFGVAPYEIWMKTDGDNEFIYDFVEEKNLTLTSFTDTEADMVAHKNDAVLQGTNGILTIGFITALLLCTVGFLIYWITSVKQRELQFGIFRAMGMSMKEIVAMLLNEHLFISGAGILSGVLVGRLAARLYMPLIQIAYSSADNALPMKLITDSTDTVRLGIVIGLMLVICLAVIGAIIRRLEIAQALKLGED